MDATVIMVEDIRLFINETYCLEEAVADRLQFYYVTKIGNNGNTKKVVLDDDNSIFATFVIRTNDDRNILPRNIVLGDINMQVRNIVGVRFKLTAPAIAVI